MAMLLAQLREATPSTVAMMSSISRCTSGCGSWLHSGVRKRVASKRVVLEDVPWTPKTRTRVQTTEQRYQKLERGYKTRNDGTENQNEGTFAKTTLNYKTALTCFLSILLPGRPLGSENGDLRVFSGFVYESLCWQPLYWVCFFCTLIEGAWSANCELKHWNFRGWKCLIRGLHFTV